MMSRPGCLARASGKKTQTYTTGQEFLHGINTAMT